MMPLKEKITQLEQMRAERAKQEERKAREWQEAVQRERERELELELEVLRLEEEEEKKRWEETEKKRKEETEWMAAEISWKKVERSYAAQREYQKEAEMHNVEAGSSRVVEEALCWNCTERKQECVHDG